MYKCRKCDKTFATVGDIRNCYRCQTSAAIPTTHDDSDILTPMMLGALFTQSSDGASDTPMSFTGGGGEFGGGGASASWDSGSSSSDSCSSSDSSSSSYDSGSSSSDSGSCGGGSD